MRTHLSGFFNKKLLGLFSISLVSLAFLPSKALAVDITILHTNDLHSHFRPDPGPLGLGGIARIKTLVDRLKGQAPGNTLLVDGGDFSEGNVYYYEGAGLEILNLMKKTGYDVVDIGNHDGLNGPDHLLDTIIQANTGISFVSANLDLDRYSRKEEFRNWILPYSIQQVGGVKIAFIGLATWEKIYDSFFSPIQITEPFFKARSIAAEIKRNKLADIVIGISHNATWMNKAILEAATSMDLIIGAHDHKFYAKPIQVKRPFSPNAWIVEAGCWGQALGKLLLHYNAGKLMVDDDYQLIPVDRSIPENPEVLAHINRIETRLEGRYGSIFHDEVGESEIEMNREGFLNSMGALLTDAFLSTSGADLALESPNFISNVLHKGAIRTADVINSIPAVYNPVTEKAWTLKTITLSGRTLKWILYFVHTSKKIGSRGLISASGLSYVFDPIALSSSGMDPSDPDFLGVDPFMNIKSSITTKSLLTHDIDQFLEQKGLEGIESIPVVKGITVQGKPLDTKARYRVALSDGLITAIKFINDHSPISELIPLENLVDTQDEDWQILKNYIGKISPINSRSVPLENRIRSLQSDLGIFYDDVTWTEIGSDGSFRNGIISVRVKNYGEEDSEGGKAQKGPTVRLFLNQDPSKTLFDPKLEELGAPKSIKSLSKGEIQVLSWDVKLPLERSLLPVFVRIEGADSETNVRDKEVIRYLN